MKKKHISYGGSRGEPKNTKVNYRLNNSIVLEYDTMLRNVILKKIKDSTRK
jgi:hypothetical protein